MNSTTQNEIKSLCWHPKRLITLEGGINFRDLGGYTTKDGRSVKWRKLFRSGAHNLLTQNDAKLLQNLGIETIADFRSIDEQRKAPTDIGLFGADVTHLYWDYHMDMNEQMFIDKFKQGGDLTALSKQIMSEFYVSLPTQFAKRYQSVFESLLENKVTLFHCSAGKDRTGVMAMILLTLCGVEEDLIIADYEMTQHVESLKKLHTISPSSDKNNPAMAMFAKLPSDAMNALMGSPIDYIKIAMHQIRSEYGSMENYAQKALNLTSSEIKQIQENYLD